MKCMIIISQFDFLTFILLSLAHATHQANTNCHDNNNGFNSFFNNLSIDNGNETDMSDIMTQAPTMSTNPTSDASVWKCCCWDATNQVSASRLHKHLIIPIKNICFKPCNFLMYFIKLYFLTE